MADETPDSGPDHDDFDVPSTSDLSSGPGAGTPDSASGGPSAGQSPATPAAGTSDPASGAAAGAQGAATTPAAPAQPPAAAPLPPDLERRLRMSGLRPNPGETPEAAQARLFDHQQKKSERFYNDWRRGQEQLTQIQQQQSAFMEAMRPILEEHYARARAAETEQLAAEIPDRETDPQGYATWLLEQQVIREQQKEEAAEQQRQEAERQAQEQEQAAQLARVDEQAYNRVAQGLGLVQGVEGDPEFQKAYDLLSGWGMQSARAYFPEASDERLAEFVSLSQQLDLRRFQQMGVDPVESIKERYRYLATAFGGEAGNGNGYHPTPATVPETPAPSPAPVAPAAPTPSPAVVRAQTEAAAAARRAPLAVPGPTRPAAPAGSLPSPDDFESSDDYVEAVLNGMMGDEDARMRPHRRER